MSIERIILDSVKTARDDIIEGMLGSLKSHGPSSGKSPERIIMDSVKSAKDDIIEGVLTTLKSDKPSAKPAAELIFAAEPSSDKDFAVESAEEINAAESPELSGRRGAEAEIPKKDPAVARVQASNKISLINACGRNRRLNIMVMGAALGLIFCLLMLISYKGDLPGEVVGIVSTISGIFGACLKDAYSFEFGSSRGSKDKDEQISSTILERMKY
jgi:hypothetical protein